MLVRIVGMIVGMTTGIKEFKVNRGTRLKRGRPVSAVILVRVERSSYVEKRARDPGCFIL